MVQRLFGFAGGETGSWRVAEMNTINGAPLASVKRINVIDGEAPPPQGALWLFRGITSNERYVTRDEKGQLAAKQPSLGRPESIHAALIPIRKTSAWWALPQDDRRGIFEDQSTHIKTGLKYLPAIARRLHHCRDLGPTEPFDFLTWFEFAAADSVAFGELVGELRASREWSYVEREIDIRLVRDAT
jgi:chlorite dismutase